VIQIHVSEVNVWINCSDMSVSVNLVGRVLIVMSTSMIVRTHPVRTMACVQMMSMDTLVSVNLAILVKTVSTLLTTVQ